MRVTLWISSTPSIPKVQTFRPSERRLVLIYISVMSTLSAILITAGTLPAIPAISAGAGGAVLASGAAHAVGAIAVGVGSWLKAQQEGQIQANQSQAQT